ncbi:MAG: alpha/beta hydrolase [Patescibacteria group bacterium]
MEKPKTTDGVAEEKWKPNKTGEGVDTYPVDGKEVEITWKEFTPTGEKQSDETIIFLTGWSAGGAKTLERLSGRFGENANCISMQVRTRTEGTEYDLMAEARGVREMILRRGLKKVIFAGHSEGGTKAVDLISVLQNENPDIAIRGLILMDPAGMYEQTSGELVTAFVKDAMVQTPRSIAQNIFNNPSLVIKGLQASSDIIFSVLREAGRSGTDYLAKLKAQIQGIGEKNNHYADVRCPIVLMQGADDPVSSHERLIPGADQKSLFERRELLKETFFPNSPRVDWVIPKKLGHHGLPHFRADQVGRVSVELINRYWQEAETATSAKE